MSAATTGLTVLVPCFNEGRAVRRLHAEVTRTLGEVANLELLLIDNGSADDTLHEIRTLAEVDPRVRYLSIVRNRGLEPAQSAGFRYASQPWIVQLDCDLQFPPGEVPKLLATAAEGYDSCSPPPPRATTWSSGSGPTGTIPDGGGPARSA